ncbi:hypothetical protein J3E69DRAFT_341886 [Trichoderma sp. SZMC 28015]
MSAWMRGRTASRPMRPQTAVAWVGATPVSSHHLRVIQLLLDISSGRSLLLCWLKAKPPSPAGRGRLRMIDTWHESISCRGVTPTLQKTQYSSKRRP